MAPRRRTEFRPWWGLPREAIELAKRRTAYLLDQWPIEAQTLPIKLANAYMQGIADAAEATRGEGEENSGQYREQKREDPNTPLGLG